MRRTPFSFWALPVIATFILIGLTHQDVSTDAQASAPHTIITYQNPFITDGDTLRCGGHRIRLAGIDAPEMPGHCRTGRRCTPGDPYASRDYLKAISRGEVRCYALNQDTYGRTIARCTSAQGDLSCAMKNAAHAVQRYGGVSCS